MSAPRSSTGYVTKFWEVFTVPGGLNLTALETYKRLILRIFLEYLSHSKYIQGMSSVQFYS